MEPDPDRYLVPAQEGRFQHTEQRSRFLAVARHVTDRDLADSAIAAERRSYHDAAHHCFAWRIGGQERSADAGEPSGTAGLPILEQIHASGLEDVVVVVSRYFGGVKLGTGGLRRAYGNAARGAIEAAGSSERFHTRRLTVSFDHDDTSAVHHVASRLEAHQVAAAYGDRAALQFDVRASRAQLMRTGILEATHGRAEVHDAQA